ncbi:MAG: rhodanese-like domain-containing protein, partial [Actinomycetota bacterium]|nr:rhodanese-like domain-containing protein [Actinomycetota bacterium]
MGDYANPGALVDTAWLEEHLNDSDLAVVEVDEDTGAYEKGHIPGAISIDWERELHDLPRREFVPAEGLGALLGKKGISNDQTIILYSGNNNWFAAYAYWLFKYRGVDNVKLLNGGRKKWELESRILNQEQPNRKAATYRVGREHPEFRIFRDEVIQRTSG